MFDQSPLSPLQPLLCCAPVPPSPALHCSTLRYSRLTYPHILMQSIRREELEVRQRGGALSSKNTTVYVVLTKQALIYYAKAPFAPYSH